MQSLDTSFSNLLLVDNTPWHPRIVIKVHKEILLTCKYKFIDAANESKCDFSFQSYCQRKTFTKTVATLDSDVSKGRNEIN